MPFIEAYLNSRTGAYHEPYFVIKETVDQDYLESIKKNKRPVMVHLSQKNETTTSSRVVEGYTPPPGR